MWSGTLSVGGCKTSTTSAPMTLRSPLSSVVTSTHQGRGEKERKPDISFLLLVISDTFKYPTPAITRNLSLEGEWLDNKASLMEFMWAVHRGVKGMVSYPIFTNVVKAMTYLEGKSTLNVILIFCICLKITPARITVCL